MIFLEIIEFYDIVEKVLSNYGISGLIIAAIIILFYFIIFKTNIFKNFIETIYNKTFGKWLTRKDSGKITEKDIEYHDIFNYIDKWLLINVNHLKLHTDFRTEVFKEYLRIFLRSYKSEIKSFIQSKQYENLSESELFHSMIELNSKISSMYEGEMYQVGIPNVVITKMGFQRAEKIQITISLIENICFNEIYDSDKNRFKIYSILDSILSVLEVTIASIEPVCNSINGALSGLNFRGIIEPPSVH
jgi:hypothetical protein